MFELTSLSRPVAITEILVLLGIAAFLGWLLARLILTNRIDALRTAVTDQEAQLDDCRRSGAVSSPAPVRAAHPRPQPGPVAVAQVTPVADRTSPDADEPSAPVADAALVLDPERPMIDPIAATPVPVAVAQSARYGSSEAAVLQRIAARSGELNFDRIGVASATDADDLKDIVGIGPFLERKLHSLGIYTFRQVASFGREDMEKVNEIIEFFPGRIERDNWVEQAQAFHERKYGKSIS